MSLPWSTIGDFDEVVDTLEPVSLRRCGRQSDALVCQGWRFKVEVDKNPLGIKGFRRIEATWQIPVLPGEAPPRPGDVLVDEQGECFPVRMSTLLRGGTRYVCQTSSIDLVESQSERFDLERPIWQSTSEGSVIVGWSVVRPAMRGVFEMRGDFDETTVPNGPEVATLATLSEVRAEAGDRVRRHRGGRYSVVSQTLGGPGEPSRIALERIEDG